MKADTYTYLGMHVPRRKALLNHQVALIATLRQSEACQSKNPAGRKGGKGGGLKSRSLKAKTRSGIAIVLK